MGKIKIIEAGNELGLGGTEYAIQLYSKYLNKDNFDVTVVAIREGGEREQLIRNMGINVIILKEDMTKFAQLLLDTDVFHWHGYGTLDPVIFNVVKANKPKLVIQTNVFGAFSYSNLYDVIDYDLYISKMILTRRTIHDRGLKNNFSSKRKALHYPVDVDYISSLLLSDDQIRKIKEKRNLQDNFIIGRIGRPDNAKFDLITLDAFAEFASKVDEARFLLIGATPKMLAHAETLNIVNKLIILENTPDLEQLLIYYRMMDIFLAASDFGETFGMVIAEAMAAGIPVVTISTPDRDNAQIELVDNGLTGLVVERRLERIEDALIFLYQDKETRAKLSASSKLKVIREYKADHIVKSLENLIYDHLKIAIRNPEGNLIVDLSQEIVDEYFQRCLDLWKPIYKLDT